MKQETLDAMRAWLDGETVEESLSSGRWVEIGGPDKVRSAVFEDYRVYRIKPRTIRIGKYDVPEPETTVRNWPPKNNSCPAANVLDAVSVSVVPLHVQVVS